MKSISSEQEISNLIEQDETMMSILRAAEKLDLPDWWIGAGFLRNRIWDHLEGKKPEPARDIDLVYYDANDVSPESDYEYDKKMQQDYPFTEWEVRNQARMHKFNNFPPFSSTADGISHWVETATCVGVKLENGSLKFLFCYGTDDLFGLIARPTAYFKNEKMIQTFHDRVEKKKWQQRWPDLRVIAS